MTRWTTAPTTLLLALVLAAPALAQRKDRDWDDDRDQGPQETENVDRTLTRPARRHPQPQDLLGPRRHPRRLGQPDGHQGRPPRRRGRGSTTSSWKSPRAATTSPSTPTTSFASAATTTWWTPTSTSRCRPDMRLDVKTFSADVTVTGVRGIHQIDGFSSLVRLVQVAGPMKVKTFSANIELQAEQLEQRRRPRPEHVQRRHHPAPARQRRGRVDLRQLQRQLQQRAAGDAAVEQQAQLPRRAERRRDRPTSS